MTTTSPTGEPAAPEHVGLALRSVASGVFGGMGLTALVLFLVRRIQAGQPAPAEPTTAGLVPNLILLGWVGGAILAAIIAWSLMQPIGSAYRRGGFAMVAAFATMVVALVTMPADAAFGPAGLLGLGGLAIAAALGLARRTRRRPV